MIREILVLGATGKTGRRLLPLLDSRGVRAKPTSRTERRGYVPFDWARPQTWLPAVAGVEAIYLVPPDLVEDPSADIAAFLDVAHGAGARRIVVLSSLGLTFPGEPPASGRRKVEAAIMRPDFEWTVIRPSGFHQNFSEGFLAPGVHAGLVRTATGAGKAALVDAHDIAAVTAMALSGEGHDNQVYAVTGPEALSFGEAVQIIAGATGRPIGHGALSEGEFRALLLGFGLPADYADVVVRDQIAIGDGFGAEVTEVVARVTGRRPIDFRQFAATAFR